LCSFRSAADSVDSVVCRSASVFNAAAGIRRVFSGMVVSPGEPAVVVPSSLTMLSTGVPSRPALRGRA